MADTCVSLPFHPSLLKPSQNLTSPSLNSTPVCFFRKRKGKMKKLVLFFLLVLSCDLIFSVLADHHRGRGRREREEEEEEWGEEETSKKGLFILDNMQKVVESEGGTVHVVRGFGSPASWRFDGTRKGPLHIGFISMEPKTLFVPQYLDSGLVLFVRKGEVRVGWIRKDTLVEKQLKMGDVIQIPAGFSFYMVNTGEGQRLQIICGIDASESLGISPYEAFYIGGGTFPRSVLAGFDTRTLATALNVTFDEVGTFLASQSRGPIVYVEGEPAEPQKRKKHDKRHKGLLNQNEELDQTFPPIKPLKHFVGYFSRFFGYENVENKDKPVQSPDPYNLYDKDPDFRNGYGYTIAVDEHDYEPLKYSDIGIYLVNLTAGSMLAPHVNPDATEYGVVLGGSGTIQVVFPNGTTAMNAEVSEGDVFWIPRYFPFCQVASLSGPLEFFGFTTSARRNYPQFLVGSNSVLRTMVGPELAAGFGVSEENLRDLVEAQREGVILPSWPERRESEEEERREREEEEVPPFVVRRMFSG